ncbi:MAG: hypothetical protein M1837_001994 [Sclerophora amabilis]|nr:MAG: hypothetical protein M1837_001994 [Sclerophora amabilis]
MAADTVSVNWSAQFSVAPSTPISKLLPGDKILLPPSALEQLLSAATTVVSGADTSTSSTSTFDPFNPYSYAAEQQARAQAQFRQQQLPHPLTFRLVNPENGRVIHAGIREFSAADEEVVISPFLRRALGLEEHLPSALIAGGNANHGPLDANLETVDGMKGSPRTTDNRPRLTVHAKQLPKGTYVRLRPLEAGYDPEDWKSLLEQHLRANFTTLTNGEILSVPGGRGIGGKNDEFRFLIDKLAPEGDGICVVDTDLEVDIEALNEEQARETLKRRLEKSQRGPGLAGGSSIGGTLELLETQNGQVEEGDYVDYDITSWDRSKGLEVELDGIDEDEDVDIYISPFSSRQRARPRADEHVFTEFASRYPKRIRLQASNVELEDAEALWVSVHGFHSPDADKTQQSVPRKYSIRITAIVSSQSNGISESPNDNYDDEDRPRTDEEQCKNCHQWVPQRTMMLHENFCYRNNILCPQCQNVFKKSSVEWSSHWHCPDDSAHGNTQASKSKHDYTSHTSFTCVNCSYEAPNLPSLAHHRVTLCPGKLILCQFCHLVVPQEGDPLQPNPEALLSNLTPHELADGARTTECHLCNKIVRLRDMDTHLRHHDLERLNRQTPRVCRNMNCGRTLHGKNDKSEASQGASWANELNLCAICFGPLYVSLYDPDGKALKRRVERRYLTQLLSGCGKDWCRNEICKSGREHLDGVSGINGTKEALPLVKPFVDALMVGGKESPLHFCVDEASQRRRVLAEMMAGEGEETTLQGASGKGKARAGDVGAGYDLGWYVAALEAESGDLDRARTWLRDWAPSRAETR